MEYKALVSGTYTFSLKNSGSFYYDITIKNEDSDIIEEQILELNKTFSFSIEPNMKIIVHYSTAAGNLSKDRWNENIEIIGPSYLNIESNSYFKLTRNILLNDVSSDTWYENENNKEWFIGIPNQGYYLNNSVEITTFKGNIDGNGYKILGLYYKPAKLLDD
jgi:hypothetical protein